MKISRYNKYIIETPYYHYNTGSANNGYYIHRRELYNKEEAVVFANKCDSLIGKADEWIEYNITDDGFITGKSKIIRQQIFETIIR